VDDILGWVGFENRDNVFGDKIADSSFEFFSFYRRKIWEKI